MPNKSLVTLEETAPDSRGNNVLIITPRPDCLEDIQDCRDLAEILEWELCNGWSTVDHEEIGALTDGLIVTRADERDDNGKLVKLGRVYWFADYAVTDAVEGLGSGKALALIGYP